MNPIPQGSMTPYYKLHKQGFLHWSSSNMVISKILGPFLGEDSEQNQTGQELALKKAR